MQKIISAVRGVLTRHPLTSAAIFGGGGILAGVATTAEAASYWKETFERADFYIRRQLSQEREKSKVVSILPPGTYVPNSKMCESIQRYVTNPLCGVYVLAAPPSAAKTTNLISQCNKLLEGKKIGGFLVCSADTVQHTTDAKLEAWLRRSLNISSQNQTDLVQLLPEANTNERTIIVIDQFDDMMQHPDVQAFTTNLATRSVNSKKFAVVLVVRDEQYAEKILGWNGGEKIKSIADAADLRPSVDEVKTLASKITPADGKLNKQDFVKLVDSVGVGVLLEGLFDPIASNRTSYYEERVKKHQSYWERFAAHQRHTTQ